MLHAGAFPDTTNFFSASEHYGAIGSDGTKSTTCTHGNGCAFTIWALVFTSNASHGRCADKGRNSGGCDDGPKNFID